MKNFIRIISVIMFLGTFAFTTTVKAQMSGTYTVGSGGAYSSLTSAYTALINNGINGPVTLSVISDLSGTQQMGGLVTGASAVNTITVTSSTGNANSYTIGTNISYSQSLYLYNGVSHVYFKDITIGESTNSTQYYGVYFANTSSPYTNIEFKRCNINTYAATTSGSFSAVYYYSNQNSTDYLNNVRFIKNNINGGYYNFNLNYLSGTTTNMSNRVGLTIDSNVLTNAYTYGIYSYYYAYFPSISHNTITSRTSSGTYYGIYTYFYSTIDSMIGNKITINSTGNGYGLRLSYYQNYSTSYGANGPMFIANNEINIRSCSSTAYGIYAYGAYYYSRFDIINNSVYINGSSSCYGLYWSPYSSSYTSKFINNNIHIHSSSTAHMIYFDYSSYMSTSYATVDYNNYYRTGTGSSTYYGSYTSSSLSSWKSSGYGQDANSNSTTISYVDLNSSLELSSYSGFTCPRVAGVLYDIRQNPRGTTTYRGCYEPFTLDAGIAAASGTPSNAIVNQSISLSATLKNAGLTTLTGATITWKFKDTLRTPILWTGSLTSGSSSNVTLGSVIPTSGMNNKVKAWVSSPNASTDQNHKNDTVEFNIFGCDSALKGTYTVGGAGAQFATLNDAIYPLMNCGISGPVTFLIRSGLYNQKIVMSGAINGSSATNTVTFTSAAGSADSVQIYTSGTTWQLSEISNIKFKDITIGTQTSIGEKAVVFEGNCSNIEFYRCNIYAYNVATTQTYVPVYYSNATAGKCLTNVKFIKNKICGGFVNMCFYTNSSVGTNYMGSVTIDSNIMTEGYQGGLARTLDYVSSYYMYFPSISYNTIIGRSASPNYQYGICLGNANSSPTTYGVYDVVGKIVGNKIKLQTTSSYGCGILLSVYMNYYSSTGSGGGGTPCLIANNEIIHATGYYSYGIFGYYSKANIINNSIGLQNSSSSDLYGIWVYNSSTSYGPMTIKNNNIAVNPGDPSRGYPIYFDDGSEYAKSTYKVLDYNNYYSTGNNVGYIGGAISDIAALQNITQQDAHSTSQQPSYTNLPNNLKVYGYNLACPVFSSVLTDIDNITRSSNTIMGAYEFVPYVHLDIQPYALVTPNTTVTHGVDEIVSIRLMNVGMDTVRSATINWSFNGVNQIPISWTGVLPKANSVVVLIDTITPISGTNTLVFRTSLPNNLTDSIRFNDTLKVNLFGCDSALKGNYTVGSGGNFITINDALNAINKCGMGGAVTFSLISGTYPPVNISGIFNGSSATNTITFTSVTGNANNVIIGNSTNYYTTALTLNAAKHLIFKNITIGLNSDYTGYAIDLNGKCENILFYQCNIQTNNSSTNSNQTCVLIDNSSSSDVFVKDVRFIKNNMDGGYYNMYFYFPASNSTSYMGASGMSLTVDSNVLTNSYYAGIYSMYFSRYPSISYNSISSRSSGNVTSNWYAMNFSYYQNVEKIVGNKIKSTNTSINYPYGIYLNQYINYTSYDGCGEGLIANNEIILYTTSSYYGIYLYYLYANIKVLHNSIYMYGSGDAYAIYTYNSNSSDLYTFKNNNIVTNAGSYAYPIFYDSYYTSPYYLSDYNNYYSTGYYLGYAGGGLTSIADLIYATGMETHSTSINPGFAATPTNLIPANWSMCPVLSEVNKDISGSLRYGITYKGCYTAVFARDAGVTEFIGIGQRSTAGTNALNVKVMNFGTTTLTSVTVQASVNGVSQTPVTLTGLSLAQYKDTIVNIGSFVSTVGVTTNLKAWTLNPNSNTDLNVSNDTATLATVGCAMVLNGVYDVGGGNNNFSTLSDALTALANCGVSGPTVLRLASGTYNSLNYLSTVYYGTSETNTITFTSLAGNADSVIIGASSGTALTLSYVKYFKFKKITIGNSNTTYGVYFDGPNESIEFYQCKILSNPNTSSSNYACVYYSNYGGTSSLKNVKFIKNHFDGGYYNMYMDYPAGSSTSYMVNMSLYIDSNLFTNAYEYGIYSNYCAYYKSISYNTMSNRPNVYYFYGINTYYYTNIDTMVGNRFNISTYYDAYALYLYIYQNYPGYGSTGPMFIANNEIIAQSMYGYVYGMYVYGGGASRLNIINNSMYLSGSSYVYGIYTYASSLSMSTTLKGNNVYIDNSGGTAYMFLNDAGSGCLTNSYWIVDYNNWYRNGTGTTYYGDYSITSFAGWQSASNQDANSFSKNPNFLSATVNLHTSGSDLLMDPLPELPYDINKVVRTPITNMGCYHDFEPEDNDVKLTEIVSPAISITTGQTTPVTVKIKNFGLNRLDSLKIHWVVNGIETVTNWYGSLAFNTASSNIVLGNFIALSGVNTITVFTTHPNGVQDDNTSNDTLTLIAFGCDSLLHGIYTVGGTTSDFDNEKDVISALKNCGINGPVEFRFATGAYGALNLDKIIDGSSSTNTITFTSISGNAADVIFADSVKSAITLYNTNNIFFNKVSINAVMANYGVEFRGSCDNIEFYGCNIVADSTTTSSDKVAVYREGSYGTDMLNDIRFIKNNIIGGYYNFYWYYGSGSSSNMGQNCIIDSNVFAGAYYSALWIYSSYTNFNSISYNKVTCRSSNAYYYYYGIYIYYFNNIGKIVGNKIQIRSTSVNYAYPLFIQYYNNYNNNPYGPMLIANNEITSQVTYSSYGGIYVYEYSPSIIINNSIYVSGSSYAYGLYLYNSSTSYPIIVKNNNIFTTTGSSCYPLYINNSTYAAPQYITLDYNNYASTGNYVGYVGTGLSTLAALKTATTQDTHSVVVTPVFVNVNASLELMDYSGMLCYRDDSLRYDINGIPRTMLTPMGAYTVDIFEGYDLGINAIVEPINTSDVFCYQDYASVRLALQNKGSYTLDYASKPLSLHVEVSGAVTFQADTLIIAGGLSPTQKDTVTLTEFLPVTLNGNYNIKAWLTFPSDTLYMDDTIQSTYVIDKIILPYSVNFDSVPKGLVFKQTAGTSGWTVQQGAGVNPTVIPSHGTGRLQFASATGRGSLASVTLQPINLRGTSSPKLEFWYAHDAAPGRDYTDVKISVDGGYTYTTILNVKRSNAAYSTPAFVRYEVNLSPYVNYSCVIIGFEAGSFNGGNQNIDSICVSSLEDLSVGIKVMEQDSFVACELSGKQLIVSLNNLTSQDFNFDKTPTQLQVNISGAVTKNYTYPLTSGILPGDTLFEYVIDTNFDFSPNGLYTIKAVLKSADDNKLNDTVKITRLVNVDLAITSLTPIGDKHVGDHVYPSITIKNNGNMPANTIPLRLQVNHTSDITETIPVVLEPGDSINYTFLNYYTVPSVSQSQPFYLLEIKNELGCDGVSANNSKSGYFNVILDEFIDLAIVSVDKPSTTICDTGKTMVYPIVKIKNLGTALVNNVTLYVTVDSAGTILKSYSEAISYILAMDSVTHTCATGYKVPDFDDNYKVTVFVNATNDVDLANNTVEVDACAIKATGIIDYESVIWTMGQNIPNPAFNQTSVPYNLPESGLILFELISVNGQLLYKEEIQAKSGDNYVNLNTESLSDGIYFYSMVYQGKRIVKKMTIQK